MRPIPPIPPLPPRAPGGADAPPAPIPPDASAPAARTEAAAVLELARRHLGEAYLLGARAPLGNSQWQGPWDCAEFCSWCLYQASGLLFGVEPRDDPMRADAYTGYWARQAREAGALIAVEQAVGIAGALLVREPRTGRVGHIAFSDGVGGTIEAHSAMLGVIAGQAGGRRWDQGILVPGIRYLASIEPPRLDLAPKGVLRLCEPPLAGAPVRELQEVLRRLGYLPGRIDGIYGPQTEAAVAAFQTDEGLLVDGECGAQTQAALSKRVRAAASGNR